MLRIFRFLLLTFFYISSGVEGFAQITITGPRNCIIPGQEYIYTAGGNWQSSDVPQMQWCAPGKINGISYCLTGVLQIRVIYESNFTSGTISLWAPSGSVNITVSTTAATLTDGNEVKVSPATAYTDAEPPVVMAAYPTGGSCNVSDYVFQWESATNAGGPFTSIAGANQQSVVPPISSTEKTIYLRRKTTYGSTTVYTQVGSLSYVHEPVSGGQIYYANNSAQVAYGNKVNITQEPGGGWQCGVSGISYRWWYKTTPGGTETLIGTGVDYPANGPVVTNTNIIIRRETICGSYSASSNELTFTTYDLNAGDIYADDTVAVSGTKPIITQAPASGGKCDPSLYQYLWEQSVNGTTWQNIGTGADYPSAAPSFTTNMYIRRQVTCGGVIAYSNILLFNTFPENFIAADRTYVITNNVTASGALTIAAVNALTTGSKQKNTTFYDGLGRETQRVVQGGNGKGKDLVTFKEYDTYGRIEKEYLPYTYNDNDTRASVSNGNYKISAKSDQENFYQGLFPGEPAYAKTTYESSPLSRPLASYAPGSSWVGSNRGINNKYQVNTAADEVRIWNIPSGTLPIPLSNKIYAAGTLAKNITLDEHGLQTIDYLNKKGQKILSKTQLAVTASLGVNHNGWICTYYVYDELGHLRVVITPKAVEAIKSSWTITSMIMNGLCYQYQYDAKSRMILKKAPGADPLSMVYDNRDRQIFLQDGNMKLNNKWLAMFYDDQNRKVMTAFYKKNISRQDLQTAMNSATASTTITQTVPVIEDLTVASHDGRSVYQASNSVTFTPGFDSNLGEFETQLAAGSVTITMPISMSLPSIASSELDALIYNYYDDYNFPGKQSLRSAEFSTLESGDNPVSPQIVTTATNMTRGVATGSRVRILGTDQWQTATLYYDNNGRLLQQLTDNKSGGVDILTNRYDFSGKLLSSFAHTNNLWSGITPDTRVLTIKSYDIMGRLLTTKKKINGESAARPIQTFTYNALGQHVVKVVGNAINTENISYNIRGWLTGVNKDYVNRQVAGYFGYELAYDKITSAVSGTSYSKAAYNGDITGVTWRGSGNQYQYNFNYDNESRLMLADFQTNAGSGWNKAVDYSVRMGDGINPSSAYDPNGNIIAMLQNGLVATQVATIDNLHYSYLDNSNQLKYVYDDNNNANSMLGDFHEPVLNNTGNKNSGTADYLYDANGNLTVDNNKSITQITYNHLDLPDKITFAANKGTIEYLYNAAGDKLQKIITDNTGSSVKKTITDYINGAVYNNDTLEFFPHEEGKVRLIYLTGQPPQYAFDYFLKDHLSNVRTVLSENPVAGTYVATMETANAAKEGILFSNVDQTRVAKPAGYPTAEGKDNKQVARLNAKQDGHKIGPSIVLRVMAGDTISISAKAFYKSGIPKNDKSSSTPMAMANALTQAFVNGSTTATNGHGAAYADRISSFTGNFSDKDYQHLKEKNPEENRPGRMKAYLSYVLFDDQFKMVDENSGVKQVKEEPDQLQVLEEAKMVMKRNGFFYVYTNTETPEDVYFDDVTVFATPGPLVEETHYYPFGLAMNGISSNALQGTVYKENKYKFNAKELQSKEMVDGTGLDWHDYGPRMYDAQTGHWNTIDPLSRLEYGVSPYAYTRDNPVRYSDPSGLVWFDPTKMEKQPPIKEPDYRKNPGSAPGGGGRIFPFNPGGSGSSKIDEGTERNAREPTRMPIVIAGWVNTGGQMIWDETVNSQDEATGKYGKDATYVGTQQIVVGSDGQTYYYAANGRVYNAVGLQTVTIYSPPTRGAGAYGPFIPAAMGFQFTFGHNRWFANGSYSIGIYVDNWGIAVFHGLGYGFATPTGFDAVSGAIVPSIFISEYNGARLAERHKDFEGFAVTNSLSIGKFSGSYSQSATRVPGKGVTAVSDGFNTVGFGYNSKADPISVGIGHEVSYTQMAFFQINR
ncbi:DUF6443 domain-containing protein [Chitinophaga sp. CC14]|uniref:DUF6443 domain-containing protein n=1 Tax=Chitinophaga sp. CC14 TaxID=3029199 RepID=UPI003B82A753